MPDPIINGNDNIKWGSTGQYSGTVVESADFEDLVLEDSVPDEVGGTNAFIQLVDGESVKVTFVFPADFTPPDVGDTITIGDNDEVIVLKRSKSIKRRATAMMRIEGRSFSNLGA